MQTLTTVQNVNSDGTTLTLHLGQGRIELTYLQPATLQVRVRFSAAGLAAPLDYPLAQAHSRSIWPSDTLDFPLALPIDGFPSRLALHAHSDPFYLTITAGPTTIYRDLPGRAYRLDRLGRLTHYQQRRDGDRFYGLGEKTGRLDRTGRRFRMGATDAIGYDPEHGDPLYKHIPFYIRHQPGVDHAIGVYYHNAYPGAFDLGCERSGYWGPFTSARFDGGTLDFFIFLGPAIRDVVAQYMRLTGLPPLPTKASLGYMGSTMSYTELETGADAAVIGFVDECKRLDIPLSGFHLSSGYTKGEDGKRYAFHWRKSGFPDPAAFVKAMQNREQVLSPNVKPGFLTTHPLFDAFERAGAFIRAGDGQSTHIEQYWGGRAAFVDFTNPAARALWSLHLTQQLLSHGISAVWNDNNEFEIDADDALCLSDGCLTPVQALRPVLANLMAQTAYEAVQNQADQRPFVLSRSGFAGLQKYAQTWSGDNRSSWADFRFNIATMLGMSLSGMPFNGMDIGGFAGPAPEPELFLRWVQNGIFHPRFCIHSVNDDNTVTEPWLYPKLLPLIRDAIRLRYRLLPTLYSLAYRATQDGTPLVRPLVYEFPDDPAAAEIDDCFLLGEGLLAVPILDPQAISRPVYLPRGTAWTCWFTGQRHTGGQTVLLPIVSEYSPLLWRDGTAVFLDDAFRTVDPQPGLTIMVGGQSTGNALLYEDDGWSNGFREGDFLLGELNWINGGEDIVINYRPEGRYLPRWPVVQWIIQVSGGSPVEVQVNDKMWPKAAYAHQQTTGNWHYDAARQRVRFLTAGDFLTGRGRIALRITRPRPVSEL